MHYVTMGLCCFLRELISAAPYGAVGTCDMITSSARLSRLRDAVAVIGPSKPRVVGGAPHS